MPDTNLKKIQWVKWLVLLPVLFIPSAVIYGLLFKHPTILDVGMSSIWFYLGIALIGCSIIIALKLWEALIK